MAATPWVYAALLVPNPYSELLYSYSYGMNSYGRIAAAPAASAAENACSRNCASVTLSCAGACALQLLSTACHYLRQDSAWLGETWTGKAEKLTAYPVVTVVSYERIAGMLWNPGPPTPENMCARRCMPKILQPRSVMQCAQPSHAAEVGVMGHVHHNSIA